MSTDDPFGFDDRPDQTIIRPTPGGRGGRIRRQSDPGERAGPAAFDEIRRSVTGSRDNPLVAAAAPILTLCAQLRYGAQQPNLEQLHQRVIREIRVFEEQTRTAGLEEKEARMARYALCATIDDIVLNTPWGHGSAWSKTTMVLTFYNETYGGKRFFEILDRLERAPANSIDVLELMYVCLSLGFEGELRIDPRGANEHARIREGLYRLIRQHRGEFERELSPSWRGIDAGHRPLSSYIPTWVIAVAAGAIATGLFMGFSLALNRSSDDLSARINELPPTGEVNLAHTAPPPPAPVVVSETLPRIKKFLEDEIAQGLVTVYEDARSITVRLRGAGIFASGSDRVEDRFMPILNRVGQALDAEAGRIIIAGHTDNIPIRTLRFPSNWHLSTARAESVLKVVARYIKNRGRMTAEGRADREPIAPNTSAEGREQNRRIELILLKQG